MRRLASTLGLVLVLAGLGGYIYFVDNRTPVEDPSGKSKAFEVKAEDIEEIEIAVTGGDTSHLKKEGGRWMLVDPVRATADGSEIGNMASTLAALDVQRVVDEKPASLGEFGLDTPHLQVSFRAKGQQAFSRIQIGDKTPTGGDVYAKRPGEPKVFLVSSFLQDTFRRNAFDLRDKTLVTVDRDKVRGVELTNGTTAMTLTRTGADWSFTRPAAMRADYGAVEGLITSFTSTLMQKFVADDATPKDLAQYGLATPSTVASLVLEDGSRVTLSLGRTENAETYARVSTSPAVVMVAPTIVGDLRKPVVDYRRHDLFDMRAFSANSVEFTRGAERIVVTREMSKDGMSTWKNASGRTLDRDAVEGLITKLANLRAADFRTTADPALKSPVLTVTAHFGENKGENRTETATLASAGGSLVASRPDEPGSLTLGPAAPLDDILKGIDALK